MDFLSFWGKTTIMCNFYVDSLPRLIKTAFANINNS